MQDKYLTAVALASDTKHRVLNVETKSIQPSKPYMERFISSTIIDDKGEETQIQQNMCKTSN